MNFIKKYKSFLSDMILNMIGFAIYIVSQQILLLPLLQKMVDVEIYAGIVLYLSILNVICNVTGGELGNVRLIRNSNYKEKNILGDFSRILVLMSILIVIIVFPLLIYLKYTVIGSILLILTILLANIRLYSNCYYRLEKKFNKVIIQNICYFVGIILSLIVFYFSKNIYLLLLIPEITSLIYALKNSDLFKMKLLKTQEFINTFKVFIKLGFVCLLTNLIGYFDKFLIYPMFGAFSVSVYYAVTSMSRITGLVSNPMSSVILSWISNVNENSKKSKVLKITLLSNIPVLLIVTILTIPLTYIALKFLYNDFLADGIPLIIPISITAALSTAVSLVKSVLLKFSNTNKLVIVYILYFITFAISGYVLSQKYALLGFCIANLISSTVLWISFIVLLIVSKDDKK